MAGDWIKMRGGLLDHPKVIALSRIIHADKDFREWLTPGGGSPMNGQIVSDSALRCVTTALLLKVWSVAREHGKFINNDLVLEHSVIQDLDQISGVSGFGDAMEGIGWAKFDGCLILPNFIEFNVPMTNAEKQKEYRERKKEVTKTLPICSNEKEQNVTSREEKRREEKNKELNTLSEKPAPKKTCSHEAQEVIQYLNEKCGSNFRAVSSNVSLIEARMKEGASVEEIKSVIDAKVAEWKSDSAMSKFLRPETLFNATKYNSYSGSLTLKTKSKERGLVI